MNRLILLWNNEIVPLAVCLHSMNNFLGNFVNNKSPPVIEAKFVFIACGPWQRIPNVQCIYFNLSLRLDDINSQRSKTRDWYKSSFRKTYATKLQGLLTCNDVEILYLMLDAKRNPKPIIRIRISKDLVKHLTIKICDKIL